MTTPAPLQRTVRRCTAVVVLALGIASGSITNSNYWGPALLVVAAGVFLIGSLVYTPPWAFEESDD